MLKITLKQTKEGTWKASGPALRDHLACGLSFEADTPDNALASAKQFLNLFEDFLDHNYGMCDAEKCDTCDTDRQLNRKTRGIMSHRKRPKRYDA